MPEARNGDIRIHFEDEGTGPALLLLHGHTLDHRVWDDVAPPLVEAGFRVVRPDLRGHGRSTMAPAGYHWSHHAADMVAVMDAVGLESAMVVGFSLGGGVALEMAVTMPGRVERLGLVAPVVPDRPFEPAFLENLKAVARVARAEGIRAAMEGPWASSPLFAQSLAKPGVREKLEVILRDFPGADYLARERDRVERSWKLPDRLGEIAVPTVVLVGEKEMPGFRGFAREAAVGIPGARLVEIPDCAHLLPLEAPEKVCRELLVLAGG